MSEHKCYAVIGLGMFGIAVAETLADAGVDVIGIDRDMESVQRIADHVNNALRADATDLSQLKEAGIGTVEAAIIAMGGHLEASILTIMNLRELKVKYIIAKANNASYAAVLRKVGADEIIQPEADMGVQIAERILNPNMIKMFNISGTTAVMEMKSPSRWQGHTLRDLQLRSRYGINVIGVRKAADEELITALSPDYEIQPSDLIVVIGEGSRINALDLG